MKTIELLGIRKSYGREVAVENLDLTIEAGEFLTILGPSGCGKTTTLRSIAGLEEPDQGTIELGERTAFSRSRGVIMPPEKRDLGLIFQSYALWPHMTVERNISLALKEKGMSRAAMDERVTTALDMVQLTPMRARYPSELSGGQQQRVAVARMIALRPEILLMDEPLSNLDAKLRTEMRVELKRLHYDLGATTIYVTHDQVEALTLSDRIVVMNKGRVMQSGTPYDIYHHPANLFVAEFIGDPRINVFSGQFGGERLDCGDFAIPAPGLDRPDGELIAAIRPEAILVSHEQRPGWTEAIVDIVQPTGASTIIQVHSGETPITLQQPGFITCETGSSLWVSFDTDTASFFAPDTGDNLAAS